ncbi:protein E6 [Rosa rugosa]|uniref:protein E6 n=1 Tax=Rosa rugosa TaxID=74645 RepID=UPI002B404249|nr:protein E6 [Rosa rugosa]
MAPSAKLLSFFFVLSLLFSQQVQARSVFFSKVANVDNHNTEELPNKESTVVTKQEQQPNFIPQTQNGYGLYGHESTELPPSTKTTTTTNAVPYSTTPTNSEHYTTTATNGEPYTTTTRTTANDDNNNIPYTHYNPNKNSNYYNNNYETNQNGMSDTRLTQQKGYTTPTTTPTSQNSNSNNYYNVERQGMSDTRFTQQRGYTTPTTTTPTTQNSNSNNYYNVERQGMSDTRFLENGKYYYDPNSENNYNQNQYKNSQVVDSRNWYNNNNNNNNRGYYGSNNGNRNTFESSDVYQNEEFQENEDDQFVP